jgi:putative phosphoribosyl transferase
MDEREISLELGPIILDGRLALPSGARGLVLFAHGSGSSRFSPRNRFVASALNHGRLATLLFDLLTADEDERDAVTAELRFDIELLAEVVSRGGRPDLAGPALPLVRAPTLLLVGGHDTPVLALNRAALAELRCEAELRIVPGATHLFAEPGTLEQAASLARDWLARHLDAALRAVQPAP